MGAGITVRSAGGRVRGRTPARRRQDRHWTPHHGRCPAGVRGGSRQEYEGDHLCGPRPNSWACPTPKLGARMATASGSSRRHCARSDDPSDHPDSRERIGPDGSRIDRSTASQLADEICNQLGVGLLVAGLGSSPLPKTALLRATRRSWSCPPERTLLEAVLVRAPRRGWNLGLPGNGENEGWMKPPTKSLPRSCTPVLDTPGTPRVILDHARPGPWWRAIRRTYSILLSDSTTGDLLALHGRPRRRSKELLDPDADARELLDRAPWQRAGAKSRRPGAASTSEPGRDNPRSGGRRPDGSRDEKYGLFLLARCDDGIRICRGGSERSGRARPPSSWRFSSTRRRTTSRPHCDHEARRAQRGRRVWSSTSSWRSLLTKLMETLHPHHACGGGRNRCWTGKATLTHRYRVGPLGGRSSSSLRSDSPPSDSLVQATRSSAGEPVFIADAASSASALDRRSASWRVESDVPDPRFRWRPRRKATRRRSSMVNCGRRTVSSRRTADVLSTIANALRSGGGEAHCSTRQAIEHERISGGDEPGVGASRRPCFRARSSSEPRRWRSRVGASRATETGGDYLRLLRPRRRQDCRGRSPTPPGMEWGPRWSIFIARCDPSHVCSRRRDELVEIRRWRWWTISMEADPRSDEPFPHAASSRSCWIPRRRGSFVYCERRPRSPRYAIAPSTKRAHLGTGDERVCQSACPARESRVLDVHETVQLEPGDFWVLMGTDGIWEARDPSGRVLRKGAPVRARPARSTGSPRSRKPASRAIRRGHRGLPRRCGERHGRHHGSAACAVL